MLRARDVTGTVAMVFRPGHLVEPQADKPQRGLAGRDPLRGRHPDRAGDPLANRCWGPPRSRQPRRHRQASPAPPPGRRGAGGSPGAGEPGTSIASKGAGEDPVRWVNEPRFRFRASRQLRWMAIRTWTALTHILADGPRDDRAPGQSVAGPAPGLRPDPVVRARSTAPAGKSVIPTPDANNDDDPGWIVDPVHDP